MAWLERTRRTGPRGLWAILVLVLAVPAACDSGGPTPSSPDGEPASAATSGSSSAVATAPRPTGPPALGRSLEFAEPSIEQIEVTDWDLLKAEIGVDGPSSDLSKDDRAAFFHRLFEDSAPLLGEGETDPESQLQQWGFTAIDLAWEARFVGGGAQLTALAFDRAFDVGSLASRFDRCHFRGNRVGSTTVYTTDLDNQCLYASPVAVPTLFQNARAAVVDSDRNVLLLSIAPDAAAREARFLAAGGESLADDAGIRSVADHVGRVDSSVMLVGTKSCRLLRTVVLTGPTPQELQDVQQFVGRPYRVLGIGQTSEPERTGGSFVFLYPDSDDARADLSLRGNADLMPSFKQSRARYGSFAFHVGKARVDGPILEVDTTPPDQGELDLIGLFGSVDLVFAVC